MPHEVRYTARPEHGPASRGTSERPARHPVTIASDALTQAPRLQQEALSAHTRIPRQQLVAAAVRADHVRLLQEATPTQATRAAQALAAATGLPVKANDGTAARTLRPVTMAAGVCVLAAGAALAGIVTWIGAAVVAAAAVAAGLTAPALGALRRSGAPTDLLASAPADPAWDALFALRRDAVTAELPPLAAEDLWRALADAEDALLDGDGTDEVRAALEEARAVLDLAHHAERDLSSAEEDAVSRLRRVSAAARATSSSDGA